MRVCCAKMSCIKRCTSGVCSVLGISGNFKKRLSTQLSTARIAKAAIYWATPFNLTKFYFFHCWPHTSSGDAAILNFAVRQITIHR